MAQRIAKEPQIPTTLFSQLDSRDVALWLHDGPGEGDAEGVAELCRLPWNTVLSERADEPFLKQLEIAEAIDDPLVRRRGLLQIVDVDPAGAILPPRHLAILLLNGRGNQRRVGMAALTRRLTMLQSLRDRSVRNLVISVSGAFRIPDELGDMWSDGFRTMLTFVSDDPAADEIIKDWRQHFSAELVDLIRLSPEQFGDRLRQEYLKGRDGAAIYRIRDERGEFRNVDATSLDDPERPVLGSYELIGAEALNQLLPSDLAAEEVENFFADATASWRPYAAGMVWERDASAWEKVRSRLRALDRRGSEENRILYVTAETGAGSTTFIRDIAWRSAAAGYPTLVARRQPLQISALEMTSFLTRLTDGQRDRTEGDRLYETPCVIVFDENHWDGKDDELLRFAREIGRGGRRVCFVVAVGLYPGISMLGERRSMELANLSHNVPSDQAVLLGRHLNRFLAPHDTARSEAEWRDFFNSTTVAGGQGIAAFWIVLSFWLQRQIDLGETIQSRVYRQFNDVVSDESLRVAILRIAAFSTVRTPYPDALLPETMDWPITDKLKDVRRSLGALGLLRVSSELDRYWAMAHDLLGRYLLTALFYDPKQRNAAGLGEALNPEHLRFVVLKQISSLPALGRSELRDVADAFAVSIFKIDPEHGHGAFAPFWSEVLDALDHMPRSVRTTSRTFLHHSAISRRRIASDRQMFVMSDVDRVALLRRAAADLRAALLLDSPPGSETDLSLFNSLAHALHDLAEAEAAAGIEQEIVAQTRADAQEATKKAYALDPDNTFVVETYARTLLSEGKLDPPLAATRALEVLTLVYSLMDRHGSESRRNALSRLAERAFDLLMTVGGSDHVDPATESGAIAMALTALSSGSSRQAGVPLEDRSSDSRQMAADLLAVPLLAGNVQAIKLRYMLAVIDRPFDFDLQVELLQSLQGSGPAFTPQMELELASLLFQNGRAHEGDRLFRRLRGMWRRGDHFVEVPQRLHWLLDGMRLNRRQVRATISSNSAGRSFARVTEFENTEVPFRAAEFGLERRPGAALAAYVSFGHNGPLLRPLTAIRN